MGFRGAPWGSVGFRGGLFWPFPPIIQALDFLFPNFPLYQMKGAPKPAALAVFAGSSLAYIGMRTWHRTYNSDLGALNKRVRIRLNAIAGSCGSTRQLPSADLDLLSLNGWRIISGSRRCYRDSRSEMRRFANYQCGSPGRIF